MPLDVTVAHPIFSAEFNAKAKFTSFLYNPGYLKDKAIGLKIIFTWHMFFVIRNCYVCAAWMLFILHRQAKNISSLIAYVLLKIDMHLICILTKTCNPCSFTDVPLWNSGTQVECALHSMSVNPLGVSFILKKVTIREQMGINKDLFLITFPFHWPMTIHFQGLEIMKCFLHLTIGFQCGLTWQLQQEFQWATCWWALFWTPVLVQVTEMN